MTSEDMRLIREVPQLEGESIAKQTVLDAIFTACDVDHNGEVELHLVMDYIRREMANVSDNVQLEDLESELHQKSRNGVLDQKSMYNVLGVWLDSFYVNASLRPLYGGSAQGDAASPGRLLDSSESAVGSQLDDSIREQSISPGPRTCLRCEHLRQQQSISEELNHQLSIENDTLRKKVEMLESKEKILRKVEDQRKELQESLDVITTDIQSLKSTNEELVLSEAKLRKSLKKLQKEKEVLEDELESKQLACQRLEEAVMDEKQRVWRLSQQCLEQQSITNELRTVESNLRDSLLTAEQEKLDLQKRLAAISDISPSFVIHDVSLEEEIDQVNNLKDLLENDLNQTTSSDVHDSLQVELDACEMEALPSLEHQQLMQTPDYQKINPRPALPGIEDDHPLYNPWGPQAVSTPYNSAKSEISPPLVTPSNHKPFTPILKPSEEKLAGSTQHVAYKGNVELKFEQGSDANFDYNRPTQSRSEPLNLASSTEDSKLSSNEYNSALKTFPKMCSVSTMTSDDLNCWSMRPDPRDALCSESPVNGDSGSPSCDYSSAVEAFSKTCSVATMTMDNVEMNKRDSHIFTTEAEEISHGRKPSLRDVALDPITPDEEERLPFISKYSSSHPVSTKTPDVGRLLSAENQELPKIQDPSFSPFYYTPVKGIVAPCIECEEEITSLPSALNTDVKLDPETSSVEERVSHDLESKASTCPGLLVSYLQNPYKEISRTNVQESSGQFSTLRSHLISDGLESYHWLKRFMKRPNMQCPSSSSISPTPEISRFESILKWGGLHNTSLLSYRGLLVILLLVILMIVFRAILFSENQSPCRSIPFSWLTWKEVLDPWVQVHYYGRPPT